MTDTRDDELVEALRVALDKCEMGPGMDLGGLDGVYFRGAKADDARDLLTALRALGFTIEPDWRPIEGAPRDAHLLLRGKPEDEGGEDYATRWKTHDTVTATGYWDPIDDAWCFTVSRWFGPFLHPTHFRPLPKPPEE